MTYFMKNKQVIDITVHPLENWKVKHTFFRIKGGSFIIAVFNFDVLSRQQFCQHRF